MKWFRGYTGSYDDLNNLGKGAVLIKQKIYCDLWFLYQNYATAKVINSKIRLSLRYFNMNDVLIKTSHVENIVQNEFSSHRLAHLNLKFV